mmetsp:Transcript_61943/g.160674  ORF Transcript_61943/g.160674 Transcript_61943/m.160674 type:complete len:219 (-) Transcript_61943:80-736(-)
MHRHPRQLRVTDSASCQSIVATSLATCPNRARRSGRCSRSGSAPGERAQSARVRRRLATCSGRWRTMGKTSATSARAPPEPEAQRHRVRPSTMRRRTQGPSSRARPVDTPPQLPAPRVHRRGAGTPQGTRNSCRSNALCPRRKHKTRSSRPRRIDSCSRGRSRSRRKEADPPTRRGRVASAHQRHPRPAVWPPRQHLQQRRWAERPQQAPQRVELWPP